MIRNHIQVSDYGNRNVQRTVQRAGVSYATGAPCGCEMHVQPSLATERLPYGLVNGSIAVRLDNYYRLRKNPIQNGLGSYGGF
jgi:hypothetical protein